MCGRFTLSDTNPTKIRKRFDLPGQASRDEQPRFNIAPTDPVLAIRERSERAREVGRLRWGLLPGHWALGRRPLINARAETLDEQPAFSDAFRNRRCLIPADGFYEWRSGEKGRSPVWIAPADHELFAFAGIWAEIEDPDGAGELHSCAIVTCEANEMIKPVHDRMPVILRREAESLWLDPAANRDDLAGALTPFPTDDLQMREVSDAVNDVRQDGPHLLEPSLKLFSP